MGRLLAAALLSSGCSAGVSGGNSGSATFGAPPTTTQGTSPQTSESDTDESSGGGSSTDPSDATAEGSGSDETVGVPGTCGNEISEAGENCDGLDFGGQACSDFGFDDGVLGCDPDCNMITDACFTCGDGEKGLAEACDGTNFGGETCMSQGFGGGTLGCSVDCTVLDTTACTPLASCGDGVRNGGEQCDGADFGTSTCITAGFDGGTLACNAGSCTLDTSGCTNLNCGQQGDLCIFDENDPQSTCCPPGVGGNILGICNVFVCV